MFCKNCKFKSIKRKMVKCGVQKNKSGIYQRYVCSGKEGCGTILTGELILRK